MTRPPRPRAYQMGRCPRCKRLHRLPLSADPSLAWCRGCFREDVDASLRRIEAMAKAGTKEG